MSEAGFVLLYYKLGFEMGYYAQSRNSWLCSKDLGNQMIDISGLEIN